MHPIFFNSLHVSNILSKLTPYIKTVLLVNWKNRKTNTKHNGTYSIATRLKWSQLSVIWFEGVKNLAKSAIASIIRPSKKIFTKENGEVSSSAIAFIPEKLRGIHFAWTEPHFDAVKIAWNPFCLNRGASTTMI